MTPSFYEKISVPFKKHRGLKVALILYNKISTLAIAAAYLIFAVLLAVNGDWRVLPFTVPSAVGFIAVSFLRFLINRPRPYEVLGIEPLIDKKTHGRSMPSRHLFSAFSIAVAFFFLSPWVGIVIALLGVILGFVRVILGVHFPSDVLVGAILGGVLTVLGMYLPPWQELPLF